MRRKVILVILDGFGYSPETRGNAVASAETPVIDGLLAEYPHVLISASGEAVGLPEGQMGNSEVGHLNLGAGRIVYQEVTRINKSIADGDFSTNEAMTGLMKRVPPENALHLLGLVSDGCVHSSLEHLKALVDLAKMSGIKRLFLHAFTDGRDTSPHSGVDFIREIEEYISVKGVGKTATVSGRYYAMDRDNRWDRIKRAYDALVMGQGLKFESAETAVRDSYRRGITDEFILPSVIMNGDTPVSRISRGDGVIFFNFRADRARQLCQALTAPDFNGFEREIPGAELLTMTEYEEDFNFPSAFPPAHLSNIFGEVISRMGMKQLRMAETEKYAHVTYFFNGGEETPFAGEDRELIPSPKIATYDLQPEMSAFEVTDRMMKALDSGKYHAIILNYANCDMVGHTGIFEAAVKAVETVDRCVGELLKAVRRNGYTMLLTADHGNSDRMLDDDGSPFTAHTTNPVHFIFINDEIHPRRLRADGKLCNIAPTMLEILGLDKPGEMADSMVEEY